MAKLSVPRQFLGAFKCGHRFNSKEFIDEEFSHELLRSALAGDQKAEAALRWLSRFNNEFHKDLIVKDDPEALHGTTELRRNCHKRNYDRRNDVYTHAEVTLVRGADFSPEPDQTHDLVFEAEKTDACFEEDWPEEEEVAVEIE